MRAVLTRVVEGPGHTPAAQRRAAFANEGPAGAAGAFVAKVARDATAVTDDDIAALRADGLPEDAVFELAVCAAVGEAERQRAAAMRALDAAFGAGDEA